jgi:hypothetical protein
MNVDTLFAAVAIASACTLAGSAKARAQDAVAVSESREGKASGDSALAEKEQQAREEATKRLNERPVDDDLERFIPWNERGGAAGWANRYGTAAPSRGVGKRVR